MPEKNWSAKTRASKQLEERGDSEGLAEEMAARTVN
jgi:hypothetical protein